MFKWLYPHQHFGGCSAKLASKEMYRQIGPVGMSVALALKEQFNDMLFGLVLTLCCVLDDQKLWETELLEIPFLFDMTLYFWKFGK